MLGTNVVNILSRRPLVFSDRVEAGRSLADHLSAYRGACTVVLGVPRGGLVVAREIAATLGAELDVVLAHKLGAPGQPEYAVGAMSEAGRVFVSEAAALAGADESYLRIEARRVLAEIQARVALYRQFRAKAPLKDRTVIVTDDGIATGATMRAALWSVRQEQPRKLVAALPVAPEESLNCLADGCDQILCLSAPADFRAVGQFYSDFAQVEDEEVIAILRQARSREAKP